jgi:hypothetical protein
VSSTFCYSAVDALKKRRKNPHAVALGRLGGNRTAQVLSAEQQSEIGRKAGKAGGKARAQKLSKEQRAEIARKAAAARWGKKQE